MASASKRAYRCLRVTKFANCRIPGERPATSPQPAPALPPTRAPPSPRWGSTEVSDACDEAERTPTFSGETDMPEVPPPPPLPAGWQLRVPLSDRKRKTSRAGSASSWSTRAPSSSRPSSAISCRPSSASAASAASSPSARLMLRVQDDLDIASSNWQRGVTDETTATQDTSLTHEMAVASSRSALPDEEQSVRQRPMSAPPGRRVDEARQRGPAFGSIYYTLKEAASTPSPAHYLVSEPSGPQLPTSWAQFGSMRKEQDLTRPAARPPASVSDT
ncbi:unnamed protein product [Effrenium voratum]|nr:unnamed protein product [Effrenium voratum]